jgi:hypothetical protein
VNSCLGSVLCRPVVIKRICVQNHDVYGGGPTRNAVLSGRPGGGRTGITQPGSSKDRDRHLTTIRNRPRWVKPTDSIMESGVLRFFQSDHDRWAPLSSSFNSVSCFGPAGCRRFSGVWVAPGRPGSHHKIAPRMPRGHPEPGHRRSPAGQTWESLMYMLCRGRHASRAQPRQIREPSNRQKQNCATPSSVKTESVNMEN